MNVLQREVSRALLRQLSGFRGYPKGDGEGRFIDVLCEISLSVEHALAIVESFDGDFPTIREMRDTALNLRPKYETKIVDQREQWEKEYGKPDVAWSDSFSAKAAGVTATMDPQARKLQHLEEKRLMLWQAIRDSLYYTEGPGARGGPDGFWTPAADKHKKIHAAEVTAFRLQLQESGWDTLMAVDWAKAPRVPVRRSRPAPILIPDRQAGDDE